MSETNSPTLFAPPAPAPIEASGIRLARCRSPRCRRPVFFATGRHSGNTIPCDPRAAVCLVLRPRPGADPEAIGVRQLLDSLEEIRLAGGVVIRREDVLGFYASHFATCAEPGKF